MSFPQTSQENYMTEYIVWIPLKQFSKCWSCALKERLETRGVSAEDEGLEPVHWDLHAEAPASKPCGVRESP